MADFKVRIKDAMYMRNMNQAELSRLTGISVSSISEYISGKVVPKQDKIWAMAQALKVNVVWLMGKDVPMSDIQTELPEDKVLLAEYHDRPKFKELCDVASKLDNVSLNTLIIVAKSLNKGNNNES